MSVQRIYLVIGADRSVRAAKRPQIRSDEVAIAVNLKFPDSWGHVVGSIDVTVPDFTPEVDGFVGAAEPSGGERT